LAASTVILTASPSGLTIGEMSFDAALRLRRVLSVAARRRRVVEGLRATVFALASILTACATGSPVGGQAAFRSANAYRSFAPAAIPRAVPAGGGGSVAELPAPPPGARG